MLLSLTVLLFFIREPDSLRFKQQQGIPIRDTLANRWGEQSRVAIQEAGDASDENEIAEKQKMLTAFNTLNKSEKRSLIGLLIAIFAWFMGYNSIETFFI